jgi:hypothetical protein
MSFRDEQRLALRRDGCRGPRQLPWAGGYRDPSSSPATSSSNSRPLRVSMR